MPGLPQCFATKGERDQANEESEMREREFYVEQTKHCLIADFHRLQGSLGREAALAFVRTEVIEPIF